MEIPRIPLIYVEVAEYRRIKAMGYVADGYNLTLPEHAEQIVPGARCAFVYDNQCLPLVIDVEKAEPIVGGGSFDTFHYIEGTVHIP